MAIKHSFSFNTTKPQIVRPDGNRTLITAEELPILKDISISILKLTPHSMREPHWHPNAAELSYCVKGKAIVTIFSPKAEHNTFTVDPGEVFYVPKGYLHYISNISDEAAEFIIIFSHHLPEDLNISDSVNAIPAHALAATFGLPTSFFEKIQTKKNVNISGHVNEKPSLPFIASQFKINAEKLNPQLVTQGGSARIINGNSFPILENLAFFNLRINEKGIREPHWHPNASELNYVLTGRARLNILSPGGDVDSFEIGPGEGSFIPAAYFHYIENIGSDELHMTVFFTHRTPNDLGISGSLSAYSDEALSSLFGVPVEYFKDMPRYQEDVMVVTGGG